MTNRPGPGARRIGRYRVVRRIGAGGMGEVLQGWDDQLQRPVALKGLPADVRDEGLRHRLRREALATAAINHPAIAHVYETVAHEGQDWLVMEYIDGHTLAEALHSGPLRCDEVARIGEAVARALQAAHEKGLIHRDVKAENVMVTAEGHVKVLDFGLAKRSGACLPTDPKLTLEGAVLGTTRAMSPEQALGRELDERSDVFSLGSLLYEMATGRPAFRGETAAETLVKVARGEFFPIEAAASGIPAELVAIVSRCLEVDPARRFASAADVADALRRLRATATHGTAALPSAVLVPPASRPRHRPALAAAAILAVALAAAAWWLARGNATRDVLVVAPLPATGSAVDARTAAAVDDVVRAALVQRSGLVLVPASEVLPCLARGDAGAAVARQVAADELLECSLVEGGDSLRITLARVEGSSGRILWSGQAEAEPGSLLHLQAEIATLLGEAFASRALPQATTPRELSADALTAYVTARSSRAADRRSAELPPAARAGLTRAAALAPRWVEPRLALFADARDGWLATRTSRELERCRELASHLQALAPDDPRVIATGVELALLEGRFDEALQLASDAVAARHRDPQALVRLGLVRAVTGDREGADEAFRRADDLAPSWWVPFARARALRALGSAAAAGDALREALRRSPANSEVLAALGDLALCEDDLVAGERWARQALASGRDEAGLRRLGLVLVLQDRAAEAADMLRAATELAPGSPAPAVELAASLRAAGQDGAARAASVAALLASDRVLAETPQDPTARAARARALAQLGRGPEAALIANELQIERRADPEAALAAALVAALVGDANTSVAALRQAFEAGLPRALWRRPELDAVRDRPEFRSLLQRPPAPSPRLLVLGGVG